MDMLLFGSLLANKGEWNGEQLLDRKAVEETTAVPYTCGDAGGYIFLGRGYGRQVWRTYNDSFSFFGMHGQFMIHNPKSDITFVCTSGCQRGSSNLAKEVIFTSLFDLIVDPAKDTAFLITEGWAQTVNRALYILKKYLMLPNAKCQKCLTDRLGKSPKTAKTVCVNLQTAISLQHSLYHLAIRLQLVKPIALFRS